MALNISFKQISCLPPLKEILAVPMIVTIKNPSHVQELKDETNRDMNTYAYSRYISTFIVCYI
jgi:hypothetical protein